MDYALWSNTQLRDAIEKLMVRVEQDEAKRPELDAQLANIYNALADPSFRDYFGVLEAAIDSHIAVTDAMETRAALLDAMAASRTFVGPSHHYCNEGLIH